MYNHPKATKLLKAIAGLTLTLSGLSWLGLRIQPASFSTFPQTGSVVEYVPLPTDLPAPVERFYRQVYGTEVPVITSVVLSGRASMRVNGLRLQGRFRFTHDAGKGYRHYIEATFFGLPLFKINEHFLDGKGHMALPFGVSEGAQIDQGAHLALWAEAIWFPALWITDARVHWQPIDAHAAILVVPFGNTEEHFMVRFDPQTGMVSMLESMRYRDEASTEKTLWINQVIEWQPLQGATVATKCAVTWFDDGSPWAVFEVEDVAYNNDVTTFIQANGP